MQISPQAASSPAPGMPLRDGVELSNIPNKKPYQKRRSAFKPQKTFVR
jgi:hypothetical protein